MKHFQPVGEVVETEVPVLDDDARLVLREDFRMRREDHFVSFWRVGDDATVWDHVRLDPSTAVMIALFDGKRTVGQVIKDFTWVAKVSEKDARIALGRFMNDDEGRLIPTDGIPEEKHSRYDPRSFIIPFSEVSITRKRTFAPLSLVWMITNSCVADCIYCFAERQRHGKGGPPLPLSRVIEILDEAASLHIGGIVIEGGDPFTHPQIVEIIEAMIARDIHVAVSTKCGLSEEMIGRLSDVGLRRLQVSIDTLDEQTHAFLTQSPGLLPKTLGTIEHALAAGFSTLVNAVLTPYNLHQIRPLVEKLVSMGVYSINFSEYVRSGYVPREDLFLTSEQYEEASQMAEELKEKYDDRNIRVERLATLPFAER
ncbi:MAG: radical SAM protein, partial [Armatimonadetes bacterium]|nr:radical SAM protein [Armatimonadota bacterium]NIM24863.1 radical SAM protein [Armatimonadota bacterium]NIM68753.1 radical SAM protein [Armatimonadota bacterium]NIM77014.1 radical SAM protein [Armatimonadota bacterium]NIN06950.1 radical SAM protein [Armatimonadota bacterium]